MTKLRLLLYTSLVVLALAWLSSMLHARILDISTPYPTVSEPVSAAGLSPAPADTIRVGVVSRFPSNVLYRGYQPLMDYLTSASDYYFELVTSRSYRATVLQLVSGEVDAAFLGSFIYADTRDLYPLVPVLKPLNADGEPFFRSVVVVKEGSGIASLSDLHNHRLALPSEDSFSGNWLLSESRNGPVLTAETRARIGFLQHHHTVIYEVMRNNFDAGAVKDRVAQEFEGRGIRVIAKSAPVPGSPLVVAAGSREDELIALFSRLLLPLSPEVPEHRALLNSWDPEFRYGFSSALAGDYDHLLTHTAHE
ncbi:phosphonate transport system substrate-binding protein [Cyclonatronum proteinivorum]|uniref:Phosphonate transport system substrate-binding protein n=1 Tax=Cyclonatronum proteinivorum TaxID=1457365 RepID=A0A345UJR4_9BACT|nr:PhnD/SsuA/transferrin family substrate-binding protein [Cyclonatronum proteinivorum]AXJ00716.1 phosphonate transport system substrate-binding protein [Cyclonatronum proteinivorum]